MAYVTGTANTIGEVTNAIISACTANGWTLTAADVISKGDAFMKLRTDAPGVKTVCRAGLGYASGALVSPCALDCYVACPLSAEPFVFPMSYHIHIHGKEVYFFVNWSIDKWTSLCFGQSGIPGGPGKGVWIAGLGFTASAYGGGSFSWNGSGGSYTSGCNQGNYSPVDHTCGLGLFTQNPLAMTAGVSHGIYVHTGLPDWSDDINVPMTGGSTRGLTFIDNPSVNPTGQTVLVPIQPTIDRGSSKRSIVLDLVYARYVRLDTLNVGDVITLGSDRWKVYPVYKRDGSVRNGPSGFTGVTSRHSGTYGYAILYDGP